MHIVVMASSAFYRVKEQSEKPSMDCVDFMHSRVSECDGKISSAMFRLLITMQRVVPMILIVPFVNS